MAGLQSRSLYTGYHMTWVCPRRLRLGEPKGHVHRAVHLDGGGRLSAGLLLPSRLGVESAEVRIAVRRERAHAQFLSQGEGLAVMSGSLVDVRGIAMGSDLAEEAQGIRLIAVFLVGTDGLQRPLGEDVRFLQAARQHLRL